VIEGCSIYSSQDLGGARYEEKGISQTISAQKVLEQDQTMEEVELVDSGAGKMEETEQTQNPILNQQSIALDSAGTNMDIEGEELLDYEERTY
jgi:hypothetical protein